MAIKYNVIIPVVNRDLAAKLLDSIAANTVIPDNILIIDNSMVDKIFPPCGMRQKVIFSGRRMGVNESWKVGISKTEDCDYVAILNDDVVLGKHFFERNIDLFNYHPFCAAACPGTVHDMSELHDNVNGRVIRMKKREGWAFSFQYPLLKKIPPIPNGIITFCGDDWFWTHTHPYGFYWYKDTGNIVYHKVGAAVKQLRVRSHLRPDKAAFQEAIK